MTLESRTSRDAEIQRGYRSLLQVGIHRQLAQVGVSAGTAQKRAQYFYRLEHLMGVHGACNMAEENFLALCASMSRFYRPSTLEAFRAALVWRQIEDLPESECWSQTLRFRRRFKGVLKICLDPKPRGSITRDQLRVLSTYCIDQGEITYGQGFAIGYFGLLRHSELVGLQTSDVEISESDVLIKIRGGKGRHHFAVDTVQAPEVRHLLGYFKTISTTSSLFPTWNKVQANRLIAAAAARFGWNSQQTWSFHCLRHGCAGHLTRQGVDLSTRLRRGRWMSELTATRYSME